MLTDEISRFLRSTYEDDIFSYKGTAFSDICGWVEKGAPDSIEFFGRLLKLIKDDERKGNNIKLARKDRNDANIDCWYLSLSIGNNKNIVVFFKKKYTVTNPPKIEKYDIYDFKVVTK